MKKIVLLAGFLMCLCGSVLAQKTDPSALSREEYDDGKLQMLRNKYWNDLRTSGEEKDLAKIEINGLNAMKAMSNRSMFKSLGSAAWQQVTLGNQEGHNTGRVRDVAADPNNENIIYVASASGGVWKTNDITATPPQWIDLSSRLPTLRTTAIAVDPTDGGILFCGTGESEGDGYIFNSKQVGVGILRSKDGGMNWEIVDNGLASSAVSQIIIDATNHNRIYAATTGGFLKSVDGGDTWKKITATVGTSILSISYSPNAPNRLYAATTGKIFFSSDYGESWTQANKTGSGLPTSGMSRVTIACSPSSPNVVYASIGTSGTSAAPNCFLGVWSSNDSGVTWTKAMQFDPSKPAGPTNQNPLGMQQWWCNALAVHPTFSGQILIGGLDIYQSGNGGKDLNKKTQANNITGTDYAHVDIHRLVFIGKNVYSCADGGLAASSSTVQYGLWRTDINIGISALQFVGADADKDFNFVVGGCQDNNTNKAYINDPFFHSTRGGDGGKALVAWDDSNIVYTTYIGPSLYKSLKAGDDQSFGPNLIEGNTKLYRDPINNSGSGEGIPDAYAAYDISSDGATIAYGGNKHVWVSTSGGSDNLSVMSDTIITARYNGIAVSPDGGTMWAGSNGKIMKSVDAGISWHGTPLQNPTSTTISAIAVDPTNTNNIYVVVGGTGGTGKNHFFRSTDGGATYTHPATGFPDISCTAVAVRPENGFIFIGTDKGMLYSQDGGVTWEPLMNGFPAAQVTSIKIKGANHDKLLAGTYGRGVHGLDLSSLDVKPGQQLSGLAFDGVQPNPIKDGNGTLTFTLPQSGQSQITLYDVLGKEIKILDKNFYAAGTHSVTFTTTGYASGTYIATLVYGGKAISQKIIIE